MSVGIKVDAQSGTINFGFTNTTSDDDWEFNIECEGGDSTIFKKAYRGKTGLEELNRCQSKWKKSIKNGVNPALMKMELVRLEYLSVAIATDPKKVQVRFEEIAHLLESQEKKINEQQHKLELLQSKSGNRGTRGRPRSNNKNAQGEGAPSLSQITPVGGIGGLEHHHYHLQDGDPSPHRNRQNSIDLKNEFEESFTRPFPSCAQKIRA